MKKISVNEEKLHIEITDDLSIMILDDQKDFVRIVVLRKDKTIASTLSVAK